MERHLGARARRGYIDSVLSCLPSSCENRCRYDAESEVAEELERCCYPPHAENGSHSHQRRDGDARAEIINRSLRSIPVLRAEIRNEARRRLSRTTVP